MITSSLDVVELLSDEGKVIGYRLSNGNSTYDIHRNMFESICESYNLDLFVSGSNKMNKVSDGVYCSDNDTAIELKDSYLIKMLLNDMSKINLGFVSKTGNSLSTFTNGVLYEGIISTDLYKSVIRFKKYMDTDGREIDLIINNDLYEIKHSDKIIEGQCRWLLNDDLVSPLKPSSLNVIYSGKTQDVYFSQKDALKSIIDTRKVYNKKLEDEFNNASNEKKLIHYINIDEFLLSI